MTDLDVIAAKLDSQHELMERQVSRIDKIEEAMNSLAVQNNMIINTQAQVDALWRKYDDAFGPTGIVPAIRDHQAQCPKTQIAKLWWALGLLTTLWGATLANFIGGK